MAALSDVRANIADMLRGRTDLNSQIDAEIGNAIRHYSRRANWITERRGGQITTVAGTVWYDEIDLSVSSGISDTASGTTPSATTNLVNMLGIDYAKVEQGTTDWPLKPVTYRDFESLVENTTVRGVPDFITVYGGYIGLWPTPAAAYTVYVSGNFKPIVPTADTDESAFFDSHLELIEGSTARRVCQKWLHDPELLQSFAMLELEQEGLLLAEGRQKRTTGRLRATW